MIRYILVGLVLFLGFAATFAPANLVDRILQQTTVADLIETNGTVWHGQGQLLVQHIPLGQLNWDIQPAALLRATLSYGWALKQQAWQLSGTAAADFNEVHVAAMGGLQALAVNQWLQPYDININGNFNIAPTRLVVAHNNGAVSALDGQIEWSGGKVRYVLSGVLRETTLPALTAYLQMDDRGLPQAVVYADTAETPLIIAAQGAPGYIKVGITKLFTKLLRNPWPGSDPDHAIVLEVEEKIF